MSPRTFLLAVFLFGGTILIGISIPLIQGRLRPNPWYGFRVRRTLEDPDLWYPVNAYSGWWGLSVGVAEIVVAAVLYSVADLNVALYASIVGAVAVGGVMIALMQCFRYLHRLTKRKDAGKTSASQN